MQFLFESTEFMSDYIETHFEPFVENEQYCLCACVCVYGAVIALHSFPCQCLYIWPTSVHWSIRVVSYRRPTWHLAFRWAYLLIGIIIISFADHLISAHLSATGLCGRFPHLSVANRENTLYTHTRHQQMSPKICGARSAWTNSATLLCANFRWNSRKSRGWRLNWIFYAIEWLLTLIWTKGDCSF